MSETPSPAPEHSATPDSTETEERVPPKTGVDMPSREDAVAPGMAGEGQNGDDAGGMLGEG